VALRLATAANHQSGQVGKDRAASNDISRCKTIRKLGHKCRRGSQRGGAVTTVVLPLCRKKHLHSKKNTPACFHRTCGITPKGPHMGRTSSRRRSLWQSVTRMSSEPRLAKMIYEPRLVKTMVGTTSTSLVCTTESIEALLRMSGKQQALSLRCPQGCRTWLPQLDP